MLSTDARPLVHVHRLIGRQISATSWFTSILVMTAVLVIAACMLTASAIDAAAGPHGKRPTGVDLLPLSQLTTQHGARFDGARLKGRPAAVFFGFTHCPDICPTTLLEMTQHLDALGPDAERLDVLFVTVDPERDTAAHLKTYVGSFHPRITALTGSPLEIAAAVHAFGATYDKVIAKDGTYTMDHTTKVFLLDRYGLVASHLESRQTQKEQRDILRKLLAQ